MSYPVLHSKEFGIYHQDTYAGVTMFSEEADTIEEAREIVHSSYDGCIRSGGVDRVDIVNRDGQIVERYKIKRRPS